MEKQGRIGPVFFVFQAVTADQNSHPFFESMGSC